VEELGQLLKVAKEYKEYPILYLTAYTGLRLGEIIGLKWENVDLDNAVIGIEQQIQRVKGEGLTRRQPKSKRSIRPVVVSESVVEVLQGLEQTSEYVFCNQDGGPRDPSRLDNKIKKILKKAGFPDLRPTHDLRHTHATLLLANGTPLPDVQERLGHERASTTANIYTHTLKSRKRFAADNFEQIMTGQRSGNENEKAPE